MNALRSQDESITPLDVVTLNIRPSEGMELPSSWLIATCLRYAWENRISGKTARLVSLRVELLARLSLLKSSKWKHYILHNSALLLDEIINLHFY